MLGPTYKPNLLAPVIRLQLNSKTKLQNPGALFGHDARPSALQKIVNSLLCCAVALNRWSAAHQRQRYNGTRVWQGFACASASRRLHTHMHEIISYIYSSHTPLSLGPPQPLPRPSASSSRALRVLPCDAAWWQATGKTNPDCCCCC